MLSVLKSENLNIIFHTKINDLNYACKISNSFKYLKSEIPEKNLSNNLVIILTPLIIKILL